MNVSDHKTVYAPFSNSAEWMSFTYNFAVEAGATGNYDLFTAGENMAVLGYYANVVTAVTSGGSLTMDLGTTSPSAATAIHSNKAVANLAINTVHGQDTAMPVAILSGGIMRMTIEAATALTGKVVFNFLLKRQ